jgi:hypothetical protein
MWRRARTCGRNRMSCGANCGTRRMSRFLRRTPCAPFERGHRTLLTDPPAARPQGWEARRSGIGQERGSTPRGDLRRRPGDGVGGVGAPARSRGASPSLLTRGPLGAHTIEGPSPILPLLDRPCRCRERGPGPSRLRRRGHGSRVPDGSPWGVGRPGSRPVRRMRHRTGQQQRRSTPRGNSRRRPGDGDGGSGRGAGRRGGRRHHTISTKAPWCSYHQVTFKTPIARRPCRWVDRGRTGARIHTARRLAASAR